VRVDLLERFISLRASLWMLKRVARLYIRNHSLRAFFQAFSFLWRKAARKFPPRMTSLAVTYRCPLQCPQCYSAVKGRNIRREMSTSEFLRVLDQLKALGAVQLIFSGGEPLLREDIFDLVAYAHRLGLLTRLSTTGHLLTRESTAKLKKAGLNQCGISIDEVDPAAHDKLRGQPGSFSRAVQGFGYLRQYGIDRKMLVYVTHAKLAAGIERFVDLGEKLGVNSYQFNFPYIIGRWADSFQEVLSEGEMVIFRRLLKYHSVSMEFPTSKAKCSAIDRSCVSINPMGDVYPCPAVPFPLGNVGDEPLAAIWRRHVTAAQLELRGRCPLNDRREREHLRTHCASVLAQGIQARR